MSDENTSSVVTLDQKLTGTGVQSQPVSDWSPRLKAAAVIIALYFAFATIMMVSLFFKGADLGANWDKATMVFNAVGALATAAAGVLLGVEVQQQNVDTANSNAERQRDKLSAQRDKIIETKAVLGNTGPRIALAKGPDDLPEVGRAQALLDEALAVS